MVTFNFRTYLKVERWQLADWHRSKTTLWVHQVNLNLELILDSSDSLSCPILSSLSVTSLKQLSQATSSKVTPNSNSLQSMDCYLVFFLFVYWLNDWISLSLRMLASEKQSSCLSCIPLYQPYMEQWVPATWQVLHEYLKNERIHEWHGGRHLFQHYCIFEESGAMCLGWGWALWLDLWL